MKEPVEDIVSIQQIEILQKEKEVVKQIEILQKEKVEVMKQITSVQEEKLST